MEATWAVLPSYCIERPKMPTKHRRRVQVKPGYEREEYVEPREKHDKNPPPARPLKQLQITKFTIRSDSPSIPDTETQTQSQTEVAQESILETKKDRKMKYGVVPDATEPQSDIPSPETPDKLDLDINPDMYWGKEEFFTEPAAASSSAIPPNDQPQRKRTVGTDSDDLQSSMEVSPAVPQTAMFGHLRSHLTVAQHCRHLVMKEFVTFLSSMDPRVATALEDFPIPGKPPEAEDATKKAQDAMLKVLKPYLASELERLKPAIEQGFTEALLVETESMAGDDSDAQAAVGDDLGDDLLDRFEAGCPLTEEERDECYKRLLSGVDFAKASHDSRSNKSSRKLFVSPRPQVPGR